MNEREHEELRTLVGAYALNATDALERRRIERHLPACDDCSNEVRMLRETAAELSWLPEPEEAGTVVEDIERRIPSRRRPLASRLPLAVAAVAIAIAGVFGGLFANERSENARFADVVAGAVQQAKLGPQGGFQARGVLHIAEGEAALIIEDLPPAGRDRAYQLWAIKGDKPRSVAIIEAHGRVVHLFDYKGAADRFALTIEPAGGSPVPTTDAVLASV